MKRSIRIVPILDLEPGSKFSLNGTEELQGVILEHNSMGTNVDWNAIPDHWRRKYYDAENDKDENGNLYLGLDTLYYRKKMAIGSSASVIEITTKEKGE